MKTTHHHTCLALLLIGCFGCSKPVKDEITEKQFSAGPFKYVQASGMRKLEIRGNNILQVKASGKTADIAQLQVRVFKDTLFVQCSTADVNSLPVDVVIQAPAVFYVETGKQVQALFHQFLQGHPVVFAAKESTHIRVLHKADFITAHAFDKAHIVLKGQVKRLLSNAAQNSIINAFELPAEVSEVFARQASVIQTYVSKFLNAAASDAATIYVKGNPEARATVETGRGSVVDF